MRPVRSFNEDSRVFIRPVHLGRWVVQDESILMVSSEAWSSFAEAAPTLYHKVHLQNVAVLRL